MQLYRIIFLLPLSVVASPAPANKPNVSLPIALYSGDRPNTYSVPDASIPTTLQIAWHYGKLPQPEFQLLVLRALNTIVDIVIRRPVGDGPLDGDKITFRSPGCHIQAVRETRLTFGILAGALRGVGELMATWGATPAEVLVVVRGERVARIYIDFNRRG